MLRPLLQNLHNIDNYPKIGAEVVLFVPFRNLEPFFSFIFWGFLGERERVSGQDKEASYLSEGQDDRYGYNTCWIYITSVDRFKFFIDFQISQPF